MSSDESGYPKNFQKGAPRRIDKDRPGCHSTGDICQKHVCGWRIMLDISRENHLSPHGHMFSISLHQVHRERGKVSLRKLLSRTNLGWHYVSASHSRPVSWRVTQRISSRHSSLSTPTVSKTSISNTLLTRWGGCVVDDRLGFEA